MTSIAVLSPNIFISQGRTEVHFYNTLIGSVSLVIGVLIGLNFGLIGVATGVSLATVIGYLAGIWFVEKLIGLKVGRNLANYTRVALAAALFGLLLFGVNALFSAYLTQPWLAETTDTGIQSLYYLIQLAVMGLISIPMYWASASLFKTDYSAQLLEDFLSKRILDKFKNIFTR